MQTNRCTYGKALDCGHHGVSETVEAHERKGTTFARPPTWKGGMRKYAGWKHERMDAVREALDAVPHRVAPCNERGYVVRKRSIA